MSATVKLPYIRFVKRVSNGASLSKYGYIGMMEQNADAIQSAPWVAASSPVDSVTLTTNQLTKTDGVFNTETNIWTTLPTYTIYMSDLYDCFKQAGDAVARNATMCGYAGCVAYRFKLPTSETANALNSISLALQRDRYLRAGVRVGLALSDSDMPSDDWSVVRGEATGCVRSESTAPAEGVVGVSSFGFLGQPDVQYLTASRAASGVITFDTSTAFAAAASYQYIYLYITLEDPAAYWNLYKENEQRQYYIEGSAMLVADNCSFTFANAPAETTPIEIVIGYESTNAETNNQYIPQDLKPHPVAASDSIVVSTCGAPVLMTTDGQKTIGMDGYAPGSTFESIGSGDPETVGVPFAYSMFYHDNLVRCPAQDSGSLIIKPAASFSVSFYLTPGEDYGPTISPPLVAIQRKKVLVPFTLPNAFKPRKVKFDWTGYGSTNQVTSDITLRHNVWLARNKDYSNAYGWNTLQKHELYTAEKSSVGDFVLLGSFLHNYSESTAHSETVEFPSIIDRGPHTLLLTLFFDMDQLTYGSNGNVVGPLSVYRGIVFGLRNPTIYGEENSMYLNGAMQDGWSPTITLIA